MEPDRFFDVHCQHSGVLDAITSLEAALAARTALVPAVHAYLRFHQTTLVPLMREEEGWLGALIDQHLPAETLSARQLRREHETIELLASALVEGVRRAPEGADVEADLAAAASDLCLLVRDHIRREDAVLRPLLQRLAEVAPPASGSAANSSAPKPPSDPRRRP